MTCARLRCGDGEEGVVGEVFGWWVCDAPMSKSITANATSAVTVQPPQGELVKQSFEPSKSST